jgi:hypothetical protein
MKKSPRLVTQGLTTDTNGANFPADDEGKAFKRW